ncbi:hypothetical protein F4778DRAFT_757014, partial [Xylariomycetidae sp. FL2044]
MDSIHWRGWLAGSTLVLFFQQVMISSLGLSLRLLLTALYFSSVVVSYRIHGAAGGGETSSSFGSSCYGLYQVGSMSQNG